MAPNGDRVTVEDPSLTTSVIRPTATWPGLDLRETWRFRSLCLVLAKRLLKVRYRQTVMGIGWAVGQPLMLMVMFSVVFGVLARLPTEGVPFPVFYFAGLAVWQVAAKMLSEGSQSIVANSSLVDRVYFPRVYLPVAVGLASMVDLAANLVALGVMVVLYQVTPTIGLALMPLLIAVAYAACLGLTLLLSALNVAYRDVTVLLPVLIQLWFFASPVIYPASIVPPEMQPFYYLNPMALVVTGMRWAVAGTHPPPPEAWPISIGVAVLMLAVGYVFFRRRQGTFADLV